MFRAVRGVSDLGGSLCFLSNYNTLPYDLNVQEFDYFAGSVQQAQTDAANAVADTSTLATSGTTAQIVGFNSGGAPTPIGVSGDANGVGLSVSAGTLTATLTQSIQTTAKPTFAGIKIDSTGTIIEAVISAVATLNFPNTAAQTSSDLTIAVPGAAVGDAVFLGLPAAPDANSCFTAFVSAVDVITVRFSNFSAAAIDPASGDYRACVFKF